MKNVNKMYPESEKREKKRQKSNLKYYVTQLQNYFVKYWLGEA